jgi:hypothetical protein
VFMVRWLLPCSFSVLISVIVIVGWTLGWTVPIFVDTTWPCIPCSITFFDGHTPIAGI